MNRKLDLKYTAESDFDRAMQEILQTEEVYRGMSVEKVSFSGELCGVSFSEDKFSSCSFENVSFLSAAFDKCSFVVSFIGDSIEISLFLFLFPYSHQFI